MRGVFGITEIAKPFVRMGQRIGAEALMVDIAGGSRHLSIIGGGIQVYNREFCLQQLYARDEGLPLDTVFIQIVRMSIARCDHDYAMAHQRL